MTWGLSFIRIMSLPLKRLLAIFLNVLPYQLESWFIHWVGCTTYWVHVSLEWDPCDLHVLSIGTVKVSQDQMKRPPWSHPTHHKTKHSYLLNNITHRKSQQSTHWNHNPMEHICIRPYTDWPHFAIFTSSALPVGRAERDSGRWKQGAGRGWV